MNNYKCILKIILSVLLIIGVIICTGSMILNNTSDFPVKIMSGFIFMGAAVLLGIIFIDKKG